MTAHNDKKPQSRLPGTEHRSSGEGFLAALFGGWRMVLPAALGVLILTVALGLWPAAKPAAVPSAAPTLAPLLPNRVPMAQAEPTILPAPVPTPNAIMPRVINRGTPPVREARTPDPEPSTGHFIVVDGDSGAVLFQQNGYDPIAPASLTKIMTAVLAIEHGGLSERVRVDVDASAFPESDVMGLRANTVMSFQDLLYGMMLASGNDAAVAIGRHVAGSGEAFVRKMNEKAAWLGLGGTHFANSYGFDMQDHYSCPADLVTLARYAMQYPLFREVVATSSYEVHGPDGPHILRNVNGILTAYPGADGVKTGDTPMAGRSLVASAVRDRHRVYVAFVRSPDGAVADGTLLLNWAFDSHLWPSGRVLPDRQ